MKVCTTSSSLCGAWDRTQDFVSEGQLCPLSHSFSFRRLQNSSPVRGFQRARLHADVRPRLDICPSLLPVTAGPQGCHCPGVFHGTTGWYGLLSAHFISPGEQLKDSGRNPMLTRAYGEAHTCPVQHLLGLQRVWGWCPRPQAKRPINLHAGRLPRAWTLGRSDTACHCFEDLQI